MDDDIPAAGRNDPPYSTRPMFLFDSAKRGDWIGGEKLYLDLTHLTAIGNLLVHTSAVQICVSASSQLQPSVVCAYPSAWASFVAPGEMGFATSSKEEWSPVRQQASWKTSGVQLAGSKVGPLVSTLRRSLPSSVGWGLILLICGCPLHGPDSFFQI
ncbi:hypothetical protein FB45DRAFT_83738 [Roridomyces roridus]|uniref:Uncharacterized protein n=1 Tax=Roridomyces roridus TaxID=1738132 RepID=A0AAD7BLT3_9AGAR|nr:hypothetical protein FB45DRAFT_83738 [Roridomyces roridus]